MDFREEIIKILEKETKLSGKELANLISVPPNSKLGDYAFPCFKLGKNAKEEAGNLKGKLKKKNILPKFVSNVEAAGPYLNFFLNHHLLAEETLKKIYKEARDYGKQDVGKGKTIAMDYSHPNIAKPFGIGHLRSTVIGNSLNKIFRFLGYNTISVNHLGDWGTQFGKLIVAYKKWGSEKELEKEPIKYLLKLYVKFHEEAEKDESLNDQARAAFKKLEDGDKEYLSLWELFKELSLKEFERIYQILDVTFDSYKGEAFVNKFVDESIKVIADKVSAKKSEGALVIDLEEYQMPPLMLKKSDGASTYHSRDIAAALYRMRKYKATKLLYVVGQEQKLYFKQLFKVFELTGENPDKFVHVDFGMFRFPEGKMSTRKGNVIFLEEVLDKAITLAEKIIEEKNPNLENKKEVAKIVGVGAIIFGDLSNDRIRNIDFDWNRMLSFDGETAPYLQYTHARACSILRKANKELGLNVSVKINFETFNQEEELAVIKSLYNFPEILVKVVQSYKPHHLAQYLISLAQAFNEFYHKCPVISDQKHTMKARLLLVDSVRQVLLNGLDLLGIKAPEEM
ncbi:MAG: arginine--tRNA ligase [Nanoarchaeota archaeon]|nr:arginine--tRNA ligase [Nanoarchaeota archaeon]MBU1632011.1 arginine--tRNA ligase [Nanoarchaeota archaeon]MBU1875626.1 arginine--tRNA ligase [Nanoarchaeota archaeon]